MNAETTELAREAVTLPGWRWMPGMLALNGIESARVLVDEHDTEDPMIVTVGVDERIVVWTDACGVMGCFPYVDEDGVHLWYPDLTDPATLGCLLALVREALGQQAWVEEYLSQDIWDDGVCVVASRWWTVRSRKHSRYYFQSCKTEAAALVAALRAAPEK